MRTYDVVGRQVQHVPQFMTARESLTLGQIISIDDNYILASNPHGIPWFIGWEISIHLQLAIADRL
jgi:hypothetical protein